MLSEWFGAFSFFVQGRMDIDPKSLWFDAEFAETYGGFFNPSRKEKRVSLPMHDHVRADMLYLLCRSVEDRSVSGAMAELGVYKGATASLFHHYFPEKKLYLLDTFSGFDPKDVEIESNQTGLKTTPEHFSDTAIASVKTRMNLQNDNVEFIQGYFPQSATETLRNERFCLVHLDADLYAPTLAGLEFFYPRLTSGGILIIHDYNAWPGVRKSVDQYCQSNSIVPLPMPDKSGSCVILKQ